jgi:hypothetical protein
LFGLLKKTRPASPFDAAAMMPSMSSRICESTFTSTSGSFCRFAKVAGLSYDGSEVTSDRVGVTQARIEFFRISCEPAPSTTFSTLTLKRSTIDVASAYSDGVLLNG